VPRAEYDVTADVLYGTSTPTPYDYKTTLTGRLVPVSHEGSVFPVSLEFQAYFNWNGPALTVGDETFLGGVLTLDMGMGDLLEVPPGSTRYFTVVRVCVIQPRRAGLLPYRRAYLLEGTVS